MMLSGLVRRFGGDAIAGLTVACVALPLNLAIAIASGLPASMGLVSGIVAGVLAGLLGGARLQITGPEAALVPVVLVIAQQHGKAGVIAAGIACGVLQIGIGLLRLGRFVRLIPKPVVRGFMAGIGVLILMSQIPVLFGGSEPNMKLAVIADPQREHLYGAIVGGIAIGAMVLGARFGALLALVVSTVLVALFAAGVGIPLVGALPSGLFTPHVPTIAGLNLATLVPQALSLALLASLGSLLSAASLEELVRDRGEKTNYNRELIAQGIANLGCALFGGLPIMGAVVRSAVSVQAGAKSRAASVVQAAVLLLAVTVAGSLVAQVPIPALAGILVVVGVRLLDLKGVKKMWKSEKAQAGIVVVTAGLIATTSFYVGIAGGILLAALLHIASVARVELLVRAVRRQDCSADVAKQLQALGPIEIAEVRGAVMFWAAAKLDGLIPERPPWPRYLVVDLSQVSFIDSAGLFALQHAIECLAIRQGQVALVAAPHSTVAAALSRAQLTERAVGGLAFPTIATALRRIALEPRTADAPASAETTPLPIRRTATGRRP